MSVLNGQDQTFTITTFGKFKADEVMVDGVSVGAVATYTFNKVKLNHRIDVTFTKSESGGTIPRRLP